MFGRIVLYLTGIRELFVCRPGAWQSRGIFACRTRSKSRCHFKAERERHTYCLLPWKLFNTIKHLAKISDVAKVGNGHEGSMFDVDWLWINAWAKSIWGISMQWLSPSLLVYSLVNRPEGGYDDEERAWRWIHFYIVSFRLKWILAKCARCCGRQWSRRWCHVASALFHWIMVTLAAGAQHALKKIAFAVKNF